MKGADKMEILKQINLYNLIKLLVIMLMVIISPLMLIEKALKKVKSASRQTLATFNLI